LKLDAVADLLRVATNDARHPTGRRIDEDTAYTHLQMAARYLQKMTALEAHRANERQEFLKCGSRWSVPILLRVSGRRSSFGT